MTEENTAPAWMEQLPDNLKGNEDLTRVVRENNLEKIGDFTQYTLKTMGRVSELEGNQEGLLRIPGEDASDEDRATFYNRLGRPAEPAGYELPLPEGFPEQLGPTEEENKEYQEILHRLGISADQSKGLFSYAMGKAKQNWETVEAQRRKYHQESAAALKEEYGAEYDANFTRANKLIDKFGTKGFKAWLEQTQLGNWPELFRFVTTVAKEFGDDAFVEGAGGGPGDEDRRPLGVDGKPRFSYNLK
jgi:hypothetical protein